MGAGPGKLSVSPWDLLAVHVPPQIAMVVVQLGELENRAFYFRGTAAAAEAVRCLDRLGLAPRVVLMPPCPEIEYADELRVLVDPSTARERRLTR